MSTSVFTVVTPDSCPMVLDQLHPEPNASSLDSVDRIARYMDGIGDGAFYFNSITEQLCGAYASGTITLSSFTAADTITVDGVTFGPVGGLLGSASTFGVLAGTAITNTGFTTINGDIGISPAGALSGFPPGTFTGTFPNGDAV